jgi:predicted dehydrogenase
MNNPTLSRRSLLKSTAAGAATVALASATPHVFGDTAVNKSPATLRWGIIGTGARGSTVHVPAIKEAPESELVALCDISEQRLNSTAALLDHPVATYSDYQKLLADPNVNAVVISAPNLLHREMLAAAIQAGKNVFCEKPTGVGPADAAAMKRSVDAAKNLVMFGMQYRNTPKMQRMAEIIAAGDIGKPRYMVQACSRGDWNLSPQIWQYADPKLGGKPMNWRFSHAASGGTLNEFSCHYFDILHWYAGAIPQSISCDGGIAVYHNGRDTWDYASVTLRYPNDITAVHTLCLFGPGRADITVTGDQGAIESIGEMLRVTHTGKQAGPKTQDIKMPALPKVAYDRATMGLYHDFLACVKTGKKPEASIDRAMAASNTCWLAELAAERKAETKWEQLVG